MSKIIKRYKGNKRGWIRIFGYGISWKNVNEHELLFSERNGLHGKQIGNYMFHVLKPEIKVTEEKEIYADNRSWETIAKDILEERKDLWKELGE